MAPDSTPHACNITPTYAGPGDHWFNAGWDTIFADFPQLTRPIGTPRTTSFVRDGRYKFSRSFEHVDVRLDCHPAPQCAGHTAEAECDGDDSGMCEWMHLPSPAGSPGTITIHSAHSAPHTPRPINQRVEHRGTQYSNRAAQQPYSARSRAVQQPYSTVQCSTVQCSNVAVHAAMQYTQSYQPEFALDECE